MCDMNQKQLIVSVHLLWAPQTSMFQFGKKGETVDRKQ